MTLAKHGSMAQFDVFENPNLAQRASFPYFVVVQSDQLDHFHTRLVMPLARLAGPPPEAPRRLAQTVQVRGERLHPAPHLAAALPKTLLKQAVGSLRADAAVLVDALDAVVSGV